MLTAISLAVFGQTIHYDFVNFDDDLYVYNAPAIRAGLTAKRDSVAFTSPHARNWHPLTTISHMLDCQLYGLKAGGHHATNVLLHTIAVLLLFPGAAANDRRIVEECHCRSVVCGSPVACRVRGMGERTKRRSECRLLFSHAGAYVRYARAPSITRYLAVTVLFAAGLMSKPMLVSAPIVLLLLDYWPLRRFEQLSSTRGRAKCRKVRQSKARNTTLFLEKFPCSFFPQAPVSSHLSCKNELPARSPVAVPLAGTKTRS